LGSTSFIIKHREGLPRGITLGGGKEGARKGIKLERRVRADCVLLYTGILLFISRSVPSRSALYDILKKLNFGVICINLIFKEI
jgi:hypothetical protein